MFAKILESYKHKKPWGPVPTPADWRNIENAIGISVPSDYKKLIEHTGGCPIGSCFLRNPAENKNIFLSFSPGALRLIHSQSAEIASERLGVRLYPDLGGLISLARVNSTHFCLDPNREGISILSLLESGLHQTSDSFSDLMWRLFHSRDEFEGLGHCIWQLGDDFFDANC
jgi:hypothetical protein